MQFKDNTVPGNYQQPIRNFVGRIVSDFVEEVDFVPNSNLRIWYNNKAEDYPAHRHSSLEIAIPMEGKYKYVFDRVNKQCYLTSYDTDEEWLMLTPEQQAEVLADGSWKEWECICVN